MRNRRTGPPWHSSRAKMSWKALHCCRCRWIVASSWTIRRAILRRNPYMNQLLEVLAGNGLVRFKIPGELFHSTILDILYNVRGNVSTRKLPQNA